MSRIDQSEPAGAFEYASEVLSRGTMAASRRAARVQQADFGQSVRAELHFVLNMRQLGQEYLESHPDSGAQHSPDR